MLNCRHKIIVYISCIKFLVSCMYQNTQYTNTKHDVFVYRVPNSNGHMCFSLHYSLHCEITDAIVTNVCTTVRAYVVIVNGIGTPTIVFLERNLSLWLKYAA